MDGDYPLPGHTKHRAIRDTGRYDAEANTFVWISPNAGRGPNNEPGRDASPDPSAVGVPLADVSGAAFHRFEVTARRLSTVRGNGTSPVDAEEASTGRKGEHLRETSSSNSKIVLDVEAAEEVADLIDDTPGVADEDRLEDVLQAIHAAGPRIASEDQRRAARGKVVAMEISPAAAEAVEELIVEDVSTKPRSLGRVRDRLRGKLQRAGRRRRGG
jgi:hypothetical protein